MVRTLPASCYGDEATFARERSAVWRDEWLLFAPATALARPGQYVADEVGGMPVFAIVEQDMYPCDVDHPLPIAQRTRRYLGSCGVPSIRFN